MNKMILGVFVMLAASLANGKSCAKMTVRKEMNGKNMTINIKI